MIKRLLFSAILLSLITVKVSFAADKDITHFTLKNGLEVYVKEDHRAPVAVFQIWYNVGGADESSGTTGLSHLLEHLMFKGTEAHPEGEFNKIITEHGGIQNAGTSNDYTNYYQVLDKKHIELSFQLESDRMQNLKFSGNEFAKELEVVKEERRMRVDNRPNGVLYERFMATAFVSSPYHNPVIGWMHELDQLKASDARQWYQQWYVPNNAKVVIVGDVSPKEMKAMAEKYFADIPRRELVSNKTGQEIEPLGERRVTVKLSAKVPTVIMGFNTPVAIDDKKAWEPYALEILAGILDGGRSARLQKELVRDKQIVSGISVDYDLLGRLPGLFTISATPASKVEPSAVEKAVFEQIHRLQATLVNKDELKRVKTQIIADKVYSQDSLSSQASMLGNIVILGLPWQLYDDYVDKLGSVTPEQIQQVAQKYLTRDRLTVATLEPQGA